MKHIKIFGHLAIVIAALLYFAGTASAQGAQDFTLINETGVEIYAVYVTPHSSGDWGDDILGVDTLVNSNSVDITFSRKERAKLWDLRVEDQDGEFLEWTNLNLLEISSVTLYYKNGKTTAILDSKVADISGKWNGYYDDGTRSPYVWMIRQSGSAITITDAKGGKARSNGSISANNVYAADFATTNGKLSADGQRIAWSDGVVWVKAPAAPDLNGVWIGYYNDGTRSPYLWNIGHTGSKISITDANGGKDRSRGTINGNKVTALDFATKNGTLSSDGNRIVWSDGVVWVRE